MTMIINYHDMPYTPYCNDEKPIAVILAHFFSLPLYICHLRLIISIVSNFDQYPVFYLTVNVKCHIASLWLFPVFFHVLTVFWMSWETTYQDLTIIFSYALISGEMHCFIFETNSARTLSGNL